MVFNEEERMKCISNTLNQSYYIGMNLIEHNIKKVIRTRDGMVIYNGELTLKHVKTDTVFKLEIRSDDINKPAPKTGRVYGYIKQVYQKLDKGKFVEISAFDVGQLLKRWS